MLVQVLPAWEPEQGSGAGVENSVATSTPLVNTITADVTDPASASAFPTANPDATVSSSSNNSASANSAETTPDDANSGSGR